MTLTQNLARPPLLTSKLAVPAVPTGLVERPRLHARLDAGTRAPLTLLTAPAGGGKTVLLSSWLRRGGPGCPAAWLSVEPGDRADGFWRYLYAALDRSGVPLPGPAEAGRPAQLAAALAQLPGPVVLILDDLDRLGDASGPAGTAGYDSVLDGLEFLLRHAAPRLALVVAARTNPALALHRWRLRGELTELTADELSFTSGEVEQLLARHGVARAAAHAGELRSRTEGWPAGARLAAQSLHGHPDPARFLRQFTGDDPRVADYLHSEVLSGQPAHVRDVLLDTSVLPRVCSGLVEALTGRADGEQILAGLERSSAFLTGLDAGRAGTPAAPRRDRPSWRRYHRLFGELLRGELHRQAPERIGELHRRACGWLAANDLPFDALRHALAAQDFTRATRLVGEHWPRLVRYGHHEPLPTIVVPPSPDAVRTEPELALAYAADRLDLGDLAGVDDFLRLADQQRLLLPAARRDRLALCIGAFRLEQAQLAGDLAEVPATALRMLDLLVSRPDDAAAAIALSALGTARLAVGQLEAAHAALGDALAHAERADLPCTRLACASRLALVEAARGRLRAAERTAHLVLRAPACPGQSGPVHCAHAQLALALVHLERDRLADAEASLACAVDAGEATLAPWDAIARARLLCERGELARGCEALHTGRAQPEPVFGGGEHAPNSSARAQPEPIFGGGEHAPNSSARAQPEPEFGAGEHGPGFPAHRDPQDPRPSRLMRRLLTEVEADLLTCHGDPRNARRSLAPLLRQEPASGGQLGVALARACLHDGDLDAAARALPDWAGEAGAAHPLRLRLDAGLIEAQIAQRMGDGRRVRRCLEGVLQLAEPEGFRRVFVHAAAPVRRLLVDHLDSGTAYWYLITDLLDATGPQHGHNHARGGPPPLPGEALTDRELSILRYLPSLLSNGEIAGVLCLSVNTVKTHVRNIYRKLEASRRRDAVRRARELHLL